MIWPYVLIIALNLALAISLVIDPDEEGTPLGATLAFMVLAGNAMAIAYLTFSQPLLP